MRIRARYLAPLLCGLAIVPLGMWHSSRQQAAARMQRWQERAVIEQSAQLLDQPIDVPAGIQTLAQMQRLIEAQSGLKVELDDRLVAESAIQFGRGAYGLKMQVEELPVGRFPLRTVLNAGLNPFDVTYDVSDSRLIITSQQHSSDLNDRYVEVYPLPMPELAPKDIDEEGWAQLLTSVTGFQNWSQSGTGGHIQPTPGALVVLQTPRMHRVLRRLFDGLEKLRTPPTDLRPVPLWPASDQQLHARILAALSDAASIDWVEKPLDEGFRQLAAEHRIPLVIRFTKLEEAAIERNTPLTKRLHGVSLRSVLRLTLSELELTYTLEDGALVITTPDDAWNDQLLVAHPVHDLVGTGPGCDYDPLILLIATTIAPQSWDEVGGPSSLQGGPDGWLIVSQSIDVHEELEFMLAQLRRALTYDETSPVQSFTRQNEKEQEILRKLDREVELQYGEMPLKDAMRLLSDLMEVPIFINSKKLDEAAVPIDSPIRMTWPTRSFRHQLRSMLPELELTYLIDDEVLQVTTPDDANSPDRLEIRLYDIRLLTDPDFGAMSTSMLEDLLIMVIAPTSWDNVGGPASFEVFEDLLVVAQERVWHEEMERFLAALEDHCLPVRGEPKDRPWMIDPAATERSQAIEGRLRETIDFTVENVALTTALERLATEHDLPLIVVHKKLEEAGVSGEILIRFSAQDMTIGGVLDRLLEPFACSYLIRDDALMVTNGDEASIELTPRLYREMPDAKELAKAGVSVQFYESLGELPFFGPVQAVARVNQEWTVASASDAAHRRLADHFEMKRTGKSLKRAIERKALDQERLRTSDWEMVLPGRPITATQAVSENPVESSSSPAADGKEDE